MSDAFEDQARALAHSIPVCDLGSAAGIRAIAIGLRETWRMATETAEEKAEKVIAGLNAQLTAEIDATGRFAARQITLEAKLDQARELGMAYSRDAKEAQDRATLLEQTIQNGAEMIRTAHARADAAEADAARYRYLKDHCSSHYAMTWEQPAEWSIGWEFQQRTPAEATGSFDYWIDLDIADRKRREAEIEAEENDGLEECGNHSATDPVKTEASNV
ncbi:hypothetical protein [Roseixanthobacter glucoisosaccharinicivorans]|uniref:hypothetical protein n=1 Tax=Roseixanthobacter glucoisosaccharinicivorans TaxID=3119923 RepID=UPI00372B5CA9